MKLKKKLDFVKNIYTLINIIISGANGFIGSKLGQFLSVNGIDNHPVFRNDFNNFTFSNFNLEYNPT